jgi:hypothetical protein
LDAGDLFVKPWSSFERVSPGERIGTRHDGTPVLASVDGHIVFPNPEAAIGHEWFYLAEGSQRLER